MKKTLFIFALAILLLGSFSVSALDSNVCCEKTISGAFCQNAPADECSTASGLRAVETSCEQSSFCQLGTCVNENTGICSPNTGLSVCENDGGTWYSESKSELAQCAGGCCQIGDEVAFVSQTECKQLASDYGVDINFLSEVNDESSCLALSRSTERGACVLSEGGATTCLVNTKETCLSMQGTFHKDLLCTAPGLSDCAKSENQICYKDDVYFLDTCGNIANIYDPAMFSVKESGWSIAMTDYWTDIEEDASCEIGSAGCGDCDYNEGSVCDSDSGDYFCKDLSCEYDTNGDDKIQSSEVYQHGESWCAESEGAYPHIEVDPITMEYIDDQTFEDLKDGFNQFNLPGTRYYKLNCWEGEVIVEPCRDYRNEICKEANIAPEGEEEFTIAQCRANGWRLCADITDRESCDDAFTDCKWLEGYRSDSTVVAKDDREDEQGSCLPIYAPGFDFWNEDNSGLTVCASGTVIEQVKYETHWLEKRSKLEYDLGEASSSCVENCFALPGYRNNKNLEILKSADNGERRSQIFYNNQEWLDFVVERGKSLGDCGYKANAMGVMGDNSTEIITALFQKLSQKGKVKSNSTLKEVYRADTWIPEEDKRVESPLVKVASFFQ